MTDGIAYELLRVRMRDGEETTVYLTRHPLASTGVSVICFDEPARLDHWCAANRRPEAIVAGFFVRDPYRPLGEVRIGGAVIEHEPAAAPWAARRACVHIDGTVRIAGREELGAEPAGDLVQAGPLLVRDGRSVIDGSDGEGFSAGCGQFDSDITVGRYPRCALGVSDDELLAVCCDGRRSGVDAGLELGELARLPCRSGARGDQPRRRWVGDARASRPSPQPPLFEARPAGAKVATGGHRAAARRDVTRTWVEPGELNPSCKTQPGPQVLTHPGPPPVWIPRKTHSLRSGLDVFSAAHNLPGHVS